MSNFSVVYYCYSWSRCIISRVHLRFLVILALIKVFHDKG